MPKKDTKERKKLVVEEVESPKAEEVVSSTELEKEEEEIKHEETHTEPEMDAPEPESIPEPPKEEIEEEIHAEEKHLHDIHTNIPTTGAPRQSNPILWIIIPGIFLLGGLLGGIVFYQKGINKGIAEEPTPTPVVSTSPSEEPSPTPLSKAEIQKYSIRIENGSGVPGAANEAKSILTKAGFNVESTGNASTYDYTDSIIQAKSDVPKAFVSMLSDALSDTYSLGKTVTLSDDSDYDVVVIIGTTKAQ
ncbi:MAG TPA: LytR C-terminal domain-containing protein [Patescibacteria group bacterium]|nr:LytR C-terminal domain-containing protein [Patescibacteria group bacterium]